MHKRSPIRRGAWFSARGNDDLKREHRDEIETHEEKKSRSFRWLSRPREFLLDRSRIISTTFPSDSHPRISFHGPTRAVLPPRQKVIPTEINCSTRGENANSRQRGRQFIYPELMRDTSLWHLSGQSLSRTRQRRPLPPLIYIATIHTCTVLCPWNFADSLSSLIRLDFRRLSSDVFVTFAYLHVCDIILIYLEFKNSVKLSQILSMVLGGLFRLQFRRSTTRFCHFTCNIILTDICRILLRQ